MADIDPLHGARLRHERAREHLADIQRTVNALYDRLHEVGAGEHPDTGGYAVMFPQLEQPTPTLSIRVGEAIYNLRAALDYVVFELARHDSGQPQEGTQFPIEDREEVFRQTRRPTYLKGVSDEHVAMVEEYQPYKGCNWTGMLQSLSNPDKHRELHVLVTQTDSDIEIGSGQGGTREDLGRFDRFAAKSYADRGQFWIGRSREMTVNLKLTATVTLPDGLPVVETLQELQDEVEMLVERFRPELT